MLEFHALTGKICQKTDISEISPRDKLNLFAWLMEDLGINNEMYNNCLSFDEAYTKRRTELWNK